MAIVISGKSSFGDRTSGFRFNVVHDVDGDQTIYETGRELESAAHRAGTLGQKIFERLNEGGGRKNRPLDEKK